MWITLMRENQSAAVDVECVLWKGRSDFKQRCVHVDSKNQVLMTSWEGKNL